MDYILGRNALNQSYVTGYGEKASQNQHSRLYAHQLNPALPNPPVGLARRRPELEHPGPVRPGDCCRAASRSSATSTTSSRGRPTSSTINWNSALAWVASFLADQGDAHGAAGATVHGALRQRRRCPGLFIAQVTITNTGTATVDGWTLQWAFIGDQKVQLALGADVTPSGATVTRQQ